MWKLMSMTGSVRNVVMVSKGCTVEEKWGGKKRREGERRVIIIIVVVVVFTVESINLITAGGQALGVGKRSSDNKSLQ